MHRVLWLVALAAVGAAHGGAAARPDPPLLVPWNRVGDLRLGEPRAQVEREFGRTGTYGSYRLHGSRVDVEFRNGRLDAVGFSTPYYRTRSGLGVGSRIPLGPCHRTATARCEHRWRGFVWNSWVKEKPCECWTKVGLGRRSLPATGSNFLKPWFFIDVRHGRVARFYFALHFVD